MPVQFAAHKACAPIFQTAVPTKLNKSQRDSLYQPIRATERVRKESCTAAAVCSRAV